MARLNSLGSTTSCSALLLSMTITDGLLSTLRRRISSAAPVSPAASVTHEVGQVDELDALAERAVVEERERREVPHQLVVRLRPGRVVERRPLGRRVGEAHLLREDRLAAARRPADHEQRACRDASAENRVERRVAGGQRRHGFSISSLAVASSALGSNGFRKNASASVRRSEPGLELMRMIGMPSVPGVLPDAVDQLAAVHHGHHEVGRDQVVFAVALEQLRGGPSVRRLVDLVAIQLEGRAQKKPHAGLVIDDQDFRHGPRPLGRQCAHPTPSCRRTFSNLPP